MFTNERRTMKIDFIINGRIEEIEFPDKTEADKFRKVLSNTGLNELYAVGIQFSEAGAVYTYVAYDMKVSVGDEVVVPVWTERGFEDKHANVAKACPCTVEQLRRKAALLGRKKLSCIKKVVTK